MGNKQGTHIDYSAIKSEMSLKSDIVSTSPALLYSKAVKAYINQAPAKLTYFFRDGSFVKVDTDGNIEHPNGQTLFHKEEAVGFAKWILSIYCESAPEILASMEDGPDVSGCGNPNCNGGCGFSPGVAGGHPPEVR
jgi:hypothetical protein